MTSLRKTISVIFMVMSSSLVPDFRSLTTLGLERRRYQFSKTGSQPALWAPEKSTDQISSRGPMNNNFLWNIWQNLTEPNYQYRYLGLVLRRDFLNVTFTIGSGAWVQSQPKTDRLRIHWLCKYLLFFIFVVASGVGVSLSNLRFFLHSDQYHACPRSYPLWENPGPWT